VSYVLFLQFFSLGFYGVLGHMHLATLGQGGVLRNLFWARKAHVAHMSETLVLSINREEVLISCNLGQQASYSNKESVPLYTLVSLCYTIIQLSSPWTILGSKGFLTGSITWARPASERIGRRASAEHGHPRRYWPAGTVLAELSLSLSSLVFSLGH
jgi:hypothetical protein